MKKIASLAMIFLVGLSLLFACNDVDNNKLYLVKQIMTDKSGMITCEYYYDENYMVRERRTSTGDISDTIEEIEYDENGYQNYQKATSKSGLVQEIYMTNDNEGRILEERFVTTYNGSVTENYLTYEYIDENDSYIRTSHSSDIILTVTNDKYGNVTKQEYNIGQSVTYENKYEDNLLIEVTVTRTTSSLISTSVIKYEYDNLGNKTKEITYDQYGNISITQEYIYSSQVEFVKN